MDTGYISGCFVCLHLFTYVNDTTLDPRRENRPKSHKDFGRIHEGFNDRDQAPKRLGRIPKGFNTRAFSN